MIGDLGGDGIGVVYSCLMLECKEVVTIGTALVLVSLWVENRSLLSLDIRSFSTWYALLENRGSSELYLAVVKTGCIIIIIIIN